MFILAFFAVSTDLVMAGGSGGKVMENAPVSIALIELVLMLFGVFIISAVMGVPVLRDYEHKTDSMIFTTPTSKFSYLMGKYLGSLIVTLLIMSGILLGTAAGQALPWPWHDFTDKLNPYDFMVYLNPWLIFVVPNVIAFSGIFFAGGALGKRMVVVYAQGIILFMGYLVAQQFLSQLDNQSTAAMLDPFGIGAIQVTTQYWTVAEQNANLFAFAGDIMWNRLIWMGVGIVTLILTFAFFKFEIAGTKSTRRKKKAEKAEKADSFVEHVKAHPVYSLGANLKQVGVLTSFYTRWILKQAPFIFISLAGIVFLFITAFASGTGSYDIEVYQTSAQSVSLIGIFNLFFIILTVLYTGELIWKERDIKMNLIYDALPYPNSVSLISKSLSMILVCVFLLTILMFSGIFIQFAKGYPVIDWNIYLTDLYIDTLSLLTLFILLGIFVQSLVNHKFVGFGVLFLFYISQLFISELGIEHRMFFFANASLGQYSEMNDYGHYVLPFSWFNVYWFGLGVVFFGLAVLFVTRGLETKFVTRIRQSKLRFKPSLAATIIGAFVVFFGSGAFIFYNTNVINEYQNSEDAKALRAEYEKTLKQYEDYPQPKIVDTYLEIDIYPSERDFVTSGYFILKNKTEQTIEEIHIQKPADAQVSTVIDFDRAYTVVEDVEKFHFIRYGLEEPLQPGESVKMSLDVKFTTVGFKESGSNNDVIFNGTFFNNGAYYPSIGYSEGFELSDDDDRKDNGLEPKERMMDRDDPRGIAQSLFGDDADKIKFETIISTDSSQIAIAPGYLQRQWNEGDRSFYHYKMDVPMVNFYAIISADFEVRRDTWSPPVDSLPDVSLEIYYHKGHEYNLDRMMRGMKEALSYYSTNFSPYQFRQLRIMEFPRYRSFAQSFANTVPFSEAIGFIQNIKEDNVDLPFYVTAHEVAHQWWGHQVTEAGVRGNAMLSETLSQYSALMVMKKNYSPEIMKEFLRHELDYYLSGRTFESKKEMPLEKVEGQGYIHYRKGSIVMYALQDYIGEDTLNAALSRFVKDWGFKDAPYPTSNDLLGYIREVTPDTLQYMIEDMFETITLYENKADKVTVKETADGKYEVTVDVSAIKYRADSLGTETSISLRDWIDIGVLTEGEDGKDRFLYLEKHLIDEEKESFVITVEEKPIKAGIDPMNKLIDRNPRDNTKTVEEEEETVL
jgi:hypothetical protein